MPLNNVGKVPIFQLLYELYSRWGREGGWVCSCRSGREGWSARRLGRVGLGEDALPSTVSY